MSTTGTGQRSGRAARRAVVRWAWRLFRREWRQQALVLAMLTVAVAAAVAGAAITVAASGQGHGRFGDAGALVLVDGTDAAAARSAISSARERFGTLEVVGHGALRVAGSATPLDVRAQSTAGRFSRPLVALVSGRYPQGGREVALTNGAADLLAHPIGDELRVDGRTRTVVGIVENPSDLDDDFALIPPGRLAQPTSFELLVRSSGHGGGVSVDQGPTGAAPGGAEARPTGFQVLVAPNDRAAVVAAVLVATTLALALVSLLAAAGFVVLAQRRQHQLGLLAALGATDRHVRLVTLANGAMVGLVAAVVGGATGVLAAVAAAPAVEHAVRHRIDRFDLPWQLIGACLAIAVAVSVLAAWWPARATARVPVMAALARRPAPARPVHRSLAAALSLLAAGAVAIASAQPTSTHVRPLVLVLGLLAVVVGVVFVAPAAVRALGPLARRLPLAGRIAVRDLVRYQGRTAAALAAVTLTLGLSVAVVGVAGATEARHDEGNLSDHQLVIGIEVVPTAPEGRADRARLDAAAARVAAALDAPQVDALDAAWNPNGVADGVPSEPISIASQASAHEFRELGHPAVATPTLLRHLGIDPASIRSTADLLTSRSGPVVLVDTSSREDPGGDARRRQRVDLPTYSSAPNSLITPQAVARNGWVRVRSGWFVRQRTPITEAQADAARRIAAREGLTVEVRSGHQGATALRNGATTVGGLVALAILAMAIGLVRGEGRRDLRTLTATGASAGTRRALTAATAAVLAAVGVLLATAGAYVGLAAAYHAELGRLVPVPVTQLAVLVIGLPLVASAGGWLLAGREPAAFSRQSLD